MNRSRLVVLAVVLTLLALAPAAGSAPAGVPPVPSLVSYQGHVLVGGVPYGTPAPQAGYFKFSVVDLAGTPAYWSNDGTSDTGEEPDGAVSLPVTNGLFSVLLGDTSLEGMKVALTADAFAGPDRLLRVWFSPSGSTGSFSQLLPDRRFTATPYAFVAQEAANAATLGGLPPSAFLPAPQNVIIVAKSGGHYDTITEALESINDAGAGNPYLIWVAPGVYLETVAMKDFVDIAGAGQGLTRIRAPGTPTGATGTVTCANNAELRDLTVESTGGSNAIAIKCYEASPRLTRVTATASDGGQNYAVHNYMSSPTMTHVTANASGGYANRAVYNDDSSPAMSDVTATATGNGTGTSIIDNRGVSNDYGSHPSMIRVTATAMGNNAQAEGWVYNYGVRNSSSSPSMTHVVATASGDDGAGGSYVRNYGVYNHTCSAPIVLDSVTATSSGLASNTGVYINHASVTIRGGAIAATGGNNVGVSAYTTSGSGDTVEISNSHVLASNSTIFLGADSTVRVAASQLAGGPIILPSTYTLACAGVYDEVFAPLDNTCQ